jgi:hypothetical protein
MPNEIGQDSVWVRIHLTPKQKELLQVITGEPATALEIPFSALKTYLRVCSGKPAQPCVFTREPLRGQLSTAPCRNARPDRSRPKTSRSTTENGPGPAGSARG